MDKEEINELSNVMFENVCNFTDAYFNVHGKGTKMDRQMWAAHNLGFVAGLIAMGVDQDDAIKVEEGCSQQMKEVFGYAADADK